MDIIIRNARVLTMDANDTEYERADVLIADGVISKIGPDAAAGVEPGNARVVDGAGKLVMPGLVNAHFHSPVNFLKGALADAPLELYMLYEVPPLQCHTVDAEFAYARTMLGAVELLKQGVTTNHDDCFFVPVPTDDEVGAVMSAYTDAGIRATVTLCQVNVREYEKYPFLYELLPDDILSDMEAVPLLSTQELIGHYEKFIGQWHGTAGNRIRCSVSCSAPQRVTPECLRALNDLSRKYDIPYKMHILETRLQRVLGEEKFGKSVIQYVKDQGVLTDRAIVIHSVWVDDEDVAAMSESGCSVIHNPISNLKIGSGVMPFRRLKDAGINIGLGIDEVPVDDGCNLWTVGKTAGLVHKIADPEYQNWPHENEILEMLTRGGARSMGLEGQVGALVEGYRADMLLIDLDTLPFTPLHNLKRALVFCENGGSLRMTIVDGRIVVEDGKILTVDEPALREKVRGYESQLGAQLKEMTVSAERLAPYYREMYLKAAQRDVGMNRWAGPMTP
jgi:cytosine/adenosine deaminase-related metal-dependent hydrolase